MQMIKLSDLVNKAKVPALGTADAGAKFLTVTSPYVVKTFNSYSIKHKKDTYPFVLEWNNSEFELQLGIDSDFQSLHVHAIKVHDKGLGTGTNIIQMILDHCNANSMTCKLHPFPLEFAKTAKPNIKRVLPGYFKLRDWYTRFGFQMTNDGTMIYVPQK